MPRLGWFAGGLALTAVLTACGGSDTAGTRAESPPVSAAPVGSFELYVLASAENDRLFADVYAITMNPLAVHRLTAGKRVSTMDATTDRVVVAAADGDVDRLGYVADGGQIVDIPGLGRPPGYRPRHDEGRILYSDFVLSGSKKTEINRFFSFDPATGKRTTLLSSRKDLFGPLPLPGKLVGYATEERGAPRLLIKDGKREVRSFDLSADTGDLFAGKRWLAVKLRKDVGGFDSQSVGLDLLDPKTGETRHVDGWQPITWTPDGTRLLARRVGSTTDSELALLDPDRLQTAPETLGTIPNLAIYSGAWVERS
ncbi:MAG: hypothetical protein ACT4QG_22665 [Sporichthyaceae bacterium]